MTPKDYEQRIAALGFASGSDWADYVGIDRTTHFRHLRGTHPVPKALQLIVGFLEAEACPFKDYAGNTIKHGDTIRHPSGQTGVVRRCPIADFDLWRVDYDGAPYSALSLQVGDKGQAVVVELET